MSLVVRKVAPHLFPSAGRRRPMSASSNGRGSQDYESLTSAEFPECLVGAGKRRFLRNDLGVEHSVADRIHVPNPSEMGSIPSEESSDHGHPPQNDSRVAGFIATASAYNALYISLESEVAAMKDKVDTVDKAVSGLHSTMDKKFDSMDKKFDTMEKKFDSIKSELSDFRTLMEELQSQVALLINRSN
ncbi:hypothetical protein B0H12DRAFT_1079738 [Mycena haematopus]|nr:hypothetical protein B0H12DRAFT_1079738 [Mycena haematopus]